MTCPFCLCATRIQVSHNGSEKFPIKNGAEFEFLYLVTWSKVLPIPIWKGCPKASRLMLRYFRRLAACSAFIFVYRSSNIYTEIYVTPVIYPSANSLASLPPLSLVLQSQNTALYIPHIDHCTVCCVNCS